MANENTLLTLSHKSKKVTYILIIIILTVLLYINSFMVVYSSLPRYHGSMIYKVIRVTWFALSVFLTASLIVDFFKKTVFQTFLAIVFGIMICHIIFIKFDISVDRMDIFLDRDHYHNLLKKSELIHQNNGEFYFLEIESRYKNEKRFLLEYVNKQDIEINTTEIIKKYNKESSDALPREIPTIKKYDDGIYMINLCLFSC